MISSLSDIWRDFKLLPWWKKLLLLLPFAFAAVFSILMYIDPDEQPADTKLIEHSKQKTDDEIEEFEIHIDESEIKRARIKENRKEIGKNIEKINKNYDSTIRRIEHADPATLSRIAAELREDVQKRRRSSS